jgi:hypothetical protein
VSTQQAIFLDEQDHRRFVECLAKEVERQLWLLYPRCLLENHYDLLS